MATIITDRVSIIVPIYNVESYLDSCIKSLINQTYKNIEILLVDDGSTDDLGKIADFFASLDQRIKVFHKVNEGVSSARNFGIEKATGDWIAFVDSDDFCENNYIHFLVQNASRFNADISICISHIINDDGSDAEGYEPKKFSVSCCDKNEGLLHLLNADAFGCALNKLYRRNLWSKIRLQEDIKINEDLLANFNCILCAEKIVYSDAKLYNYRLRQGSASRSGFSKKQFDCVKVNKEIVQNTRKLHLSRDIQYVAEKRYACTLITIYRGADKSNNIEVKEEVLELVKEDISMFLHNSVISPSKKFELCILRYLPIFYKLIIL